MGYFGKLPACADFVKAGGNGALTGLCECYWEGPYPAPDEGDYEQRIGNLSWLPSRSLQLTRAIPLSEAGGCALADYATARQRAVRESGRLGRIAAAPMVACGPQRARRPGPVLPRLCESC
ncbi:type VI secretion system ImpA family N-terminal domain-containing protein [Janthinobacterium sp.]|uniref:type VI secretion system ImpA family N-terminal domain-containing protein n=1 Tax=Janthinobacterium sp. TaxID=1871054 RepID=UPI003977BD8E